MKDNLKIIKIQKRISHRAIASGWGAMPQDKFFHCNRGEEGSVLFFKHLVFPPGTRICPYPPHALDTGPFPQDYDQN